MSTATAAVPYRIGEPDIDCRYPVILGEDQVIGQAFRWHRNWLVVDSHAVETTLYRPAKGTQGIDLAAAYLTAEYTARRITSIPLVQLLAEAPQPLMGPVPLLHPRMPEDPRNRNIEGAHRAFAGLAAHRWRAVRTGFPGSDNPWYLRCELCGWEGVKYWSHLRGRNGRPPSPHRHPGKESRASGCIGADKVRELISAYQQ